MKNALIKLFLIFLKICSILSLGQIFNPNNQMIFPNYNPFNTYNLNQNPYENMMKYMQMMNVLQPQQFNNNMMMNQMYPPNISVI